MKRQSIRAVLAGVIGALCASSPPWSGARASPAAVAKTATSALGQQNANLYTVVNLGPEPASAALNERGEVAFNTFNDFGPIAQFFDGERIVPIGSLGSGFALVQGFNNRGVVAGVSSPDGQRDLSQGFVWTRAGGMRALPGAPPISARDVDDRNEIVGWASVAGAGVRAMRWNADGGMTPLGPLPASSSEAFGINDRGYATGYTTVGAGAIHAHATLWDRAGGQTDLGPAAGGDGFGLRINERNEVAGVIDYPPPGRSQGFFWSRDSGMVPIDAGPDFRLADLNNRGEVVGAAEIGGRRTVFQWTLGRGVVALPLGAGALGDGGDINDHGEIVGTVQRPPAEGGASRAVRWPSSSAQPIDLNTQLYRAPAGLALSHAFAINDNGVILADSNAGLVLLRPGRRGTDAPVAGPVAGLAATVELGQELALTIDFADNDSAQTHTASVLWTDGCASPAPTVTQAGGVGQVRLRHRFCAAGYHGLRVRISDSGGRYTEVEKDVVVAAPALAALSGEGVLPRAAAPATRAGNNAPLRFALWAPLAGASAAGGGAPTVRFSGPFQFRSDRLTVAAAGADRARVEGTGRLNGRAGYRFVLDAVDGGAARWAGADRLRVRITHADPAGGADVVDYDNGAPAASTGADRTAVADGGLTLRP